MPRYTPSCFRWGGRYVYSSWFHSRHVERNYRGLCDALKGRLVRRPMSATAPPERKVHSPIAAWSVIRFRNTNFRSGRQAGLGRAAACWRFGLVHLADWPEADRPERHFVPRSSYGQNRPRKAAEAKAVAAG
jgi:hypothetical protein